MSAVSNFMTFRPVLLLAIPLLAVGCTPEARDDAITRGSAMGQEAAHRVASAAGDAWKSLADQVSKLSPDSAMSALEDARKSLEKATADLKPGEKLEAAKSEIERIQAAIDLQDLRRQADEKLAEAQKLKENAGKTMDEIRERLESADRTYQELKDHINGAEMMYQEAAKNAEHAREMAAQATAQVTGGK